MAKRFRVALSFPGEHRGRVEKIAEALGDKLTRDKVLYDRWYAPEFNRLNLDVYLPSLYHDQSELIAVFLCKEYNDKEWCGLEWRACRDLIKRRNDVRLMFFRLDDADIEGLYSIDGYQSIRHMSDAEVAASILSQLPPLGTAATYRAFTSKLPVVNSTLIGREDELAFLDRAWKDPATNFVQVIAAGGTGKTALVDKWFRRHLGEAMVFGWSFYSQGSSPDRQTSSDPFFAEILAWLNIDIAPTVSVYTKAEAVARHLRDERVLLLLDGVEPLQDAAGVMRDAALRALLLELETGNRGLVVCTTRARVDIPDDEPRVLSIDLDNLTAEQGAQYLRSLRVEGSDEELKQASREYGNHALALTLLGTYLADFHEHDISRRVEIRDLIQEEGKPYDHARRVIEAYDRMFVGKPEADVLGALGYFGRPAEPAALELVLPIVEDRRYLRALKRLREARLILTTDLAQPLDCHPLIREHFAQASNAVGHAKLFEHYQKQAPPQPESLEKMTPLFYAVYHGCRAGRHPEALNIVYRGRILRGREDYLNKKLGAYGTDLSLLANFFEIPWIHPVASLSSAEQSWVLSCAGFTLRALGRLADAGLPIRDGAKIRVDSEDWRHAATSYSNISGLEFSLGNLSKAIEAAHQAIEFADRSGDGYHRTARRANLAGALHQFGELAAAEHYFRESERLQSECQPGQPILSSVPGYRYCDLLLDQYRAPEVLHRASRTLDWATRLGDLKDIGLDHLSLGRAHAQGSPEAMYHLDQAVEFLRRAGTLHQLPRALLARGTRHDLDEVFRIATRSGMRLHLADYHLAKGNVAEAEKLINETGYHRRDKELAALKAKTVTA